MRVKSITIKNFRMLHNIEVDLEDDITLIVGKNNSGKTSFFEIIKMMLADESSLTFEDFSQNCYKKFKEAEVNFKLYLATSNESEKEDALKRFQETLPKIELFIKFQYDKESDSLMELSEFITDLDPNRDDACLCVCYESFNSLGLLKSFTESKEIGKNLLLFLKENIHSYYKINCYAYDSPSGYKREIEANFKRKVRKIVSFEEIKALRILDDKKGDRNNTLAVGFANYYRQRDKTKEDVERLEIRLQEVGTELKEKYGQILKSILDDLKTFGATTPIIIPDIIIDSVFDSESIIKNNIRYLYKQDEINLPESYNGLGYSNLIYMILEFASFIEKQLNAKQEKESEFIVIMVEEPEAHMHPQMQQVFINQVKELLSKAKKKGIISQLIITSHSSHIISEAGIDLNRGFNRIRYFAKELDYIAAKDFNRLDIGGDKKTFRFLKHYLNLHKSDLFFADKVIMVEGITERLLMPQMIAKVAPSLLNEYITILEVGGAYTHKFKEILDFIGVKTLLITDLDSINQSTREACPVDRMDSTSESSNETLKQWLPKKTLIIELLNCVEENKIHNNLIRVAYQVSELDMAYFPRSFEEAFIERNKKFILSVIKDPKTFESITIKNEFTQFRNKSIEFMNEKTSYDLAPSTSKSKTNFAFDIMSMDESILGEWHVPLYIKEGLEWLAGMCIVKYKVKSI